MSLWQTCLCYQKPPPPPLAYPAKPTPVSLCEGKDGIEFQNKRRRKKGGGASLSRDEDHQCQLCVMPLEISRSSAMNCIPAMLLLFYFISLLHFERCHYMTMMDSFCQYQICYCCIFQKNKQTKKTDMGLYILENTCTKHASTARLCASVGCAENTGWGDRGKNMKKKKCCSFYLLFFKYWRHPKEADYLLSGKISDFITYLAAMRERGGMKGGRKAAVVNSSVFTQCIESSVNISEGLNWCVRLLFRARRLSSQNADIASVHPHKLCLYS